MTAQTFVCSTSIADAPVARQKAAKVVERINRVNLKGFVEEQDGLFVSVDFTKLNGEPRTLTGRLGVKSYLKGGVNTVEANARPYLTVFDVEVLAYRTVNLSNVSEIRARNKVYQVID